MRTETANVIRLADYHVPDYLVDFVDLDVSLAETDATITSTLTLRPNPAGRAGAPLHLDGDELQAAGVWLDGAELDLASGFCTAQGMIITAPPQRPFTLKIITRLQPATNTKLMGLYRSGAAFCTQCEAEGFRRITYFPDRPDVLSRYRTRIEADRTIAPVLLGNGNCVMQGDITGTNRHFAIWEDPHPKPCYLFALVAGRLDALHDHFTTRSGRKVALGIYVEPGKTAAAAYAMDALKRSMAWDETAFGREYDLDVFNIAAVSDFNMGAMENKGLNVFNDKLVLASPQTATDADYEQIEAVIAHEYFHNWTGNRITCRDWFQLCLKEGLTVYRDQEFSSDQRSRAVQRIADVQQLRATQFPEDNGPLAHSVRPETYHEINNFYTATIYEKGAELIRVLKRLIGREAFARGMELYFTRCDGQAVTMEDFIAAFAEVSGRDLTHFMRWYSQAGTPRLKVATHHDIATKIFSLDMWQTNPPTLGQPDKVPLVLPVALALLAADGKELPLICKEVAGASARECATGLFEMASAHRRIEFHDITARPILSVLRDFSAPVTLDLDASEADLVHQLQHDRDPFNRWQAGQTMALRLLVAGCDAARPRPSTEPFVKALERLMVAHADDPAFVALALALPTEGDIVREIGKDADPEAIFASREALRAAMGQGLATHLREICGQAPPQGAFSPDAAAAGQRALQSAALQLLSAGFPDEGAGLAQRKFAQSRSMSEQMAALSALTARGRPEGAAALAQFYEQHQDNALVIDKWFSLQAMAVRPDTLAQVRALSAHPAFAWTNPNRVRALIGAFVNGNHRGFHAVDGSGYAFLAECVLRLDGANPQVAARLLSAMRSWKMMTQRHCNQALAALKTIAGQSILSADVRDIVTRMLA